MKERLTYEHVKDFIEKNCKGDILISTEYIRSSSKLKLRCHICGEEYEMSWVHIYSGSGHRPCMMKENGKNRKFTHEYVSEYIESRGCKLLSKEYNGTKEKLEILFSCGHSDWRDFDSFKHCKNICSRCSGTKKYTYDEIKNIFKSNGFNLISNQYINYKDKLIFSDLIGYKYNICFSTFVETFINKNGNLSKFDNSNDYTMDNIQLFLELHIPNFHLLDGQKWHGNHVKIMLYDDDGYKYSTNLNSLQGLIANNSFPSKFHKYNIFTIDNINLWLKLNNKDFYLLPDQQYKNINSLLYFKCNNCKEDEIPFKMDFSNIEHGIGCPICCGRQIGKYNNLLYLYPEIAKEWDYNKNYPIKPENVAPHTNKKYHWICKMGHSYYISPNSRCGSKQTGCVICNLSKGEEKIKEFLNSHFIKYEHEFRFNDCRNKNPLPFDIYLHNYNICIEYQGIQHFQSMEYFGGEESFDYLKKNDKIKYEYCKSKNIKLIEIPYWDFNNIELILTKELNLTL